MIHYLTDIVTDVIFRVRMMAWRVDVSRLVEHQSNSLVFDDFINALEVSLSFDWVSFGAPVT